MKSTLREEFIGRIMRFMGSAIIYNWSCKHLIAEIERVIEVYRMTEGK